MQPDDLRRMLRTAPEREPLLSESGSSLGPQHRWLRRVTLLTGALAMLCGGAYITVRSQSELASKSTTTSELGDRPPPNAADAAWAAFKDAYAKEYESEDAESESRANFEARVVSLEALNARNGERVFGVTRHADRPLGKAAYSRGRRPRDAERDAARSHAGRVALESVDDADLPDVVDWRTDARGVVTPVKNQGQCGSCWAFSAAEQVESQLVLAGSPAVELSPQQLASCTADPVADACCDGCGGGDPSAAYEYLIEAHSKDAGSGLAPEAYWPYSQGLTPEAECEMPFCTEACDRDLSVLKTDYEFIGPYAVVTSYGFAVPECAQGACDDQNLSQLAARAARSPVSVCLNAGAWDDYVGGVLTAQSCGGSSADDVDHCVQLVGYNRHQNYWIVRNSWSSDWGEDGFIRLQFDANTCGIANEATIVQVQGQWSQPASR